MHISSGYTQPKICILWKIDSTIAKRLRSISSNAWKSKIQFVYILEAFTLKDNYKMIPHGIWEYIATLRPFHLT